MSDELVSEMYKDFNIPNYFVPVFRDMGINFICFIEFDIEIGQVVYISEIKTGSEYINEIRNIGKLSQVYAGVAENNIDEFSVSDLEKIVVARLDVETETYAQTVSVLLVSCLPTSETSEIQKIAQSTLTKSKARPDLIPKLFYQKLQEYNFKKLSVIRLKGDQQKLKINSSSRITEELNFQFIKAFLLIDLNTNVVDLRFFPQSIKDKSIESIEFLSLLVDYHQTVRPFEMRTIIFNNIPFQYLSSDKNTIVVLYFSETEIYGTARFTEISEGIIKIIYDNWKDASKIEQLHLFELFDLTLTKKIPLASIEKYAQISLRSERIIPTINHDMLFDLKIEIDPLINSQLWANLKSLNGEESVHELTQAWNKNILQTILLLEWARVRNVLSYVDKAKR